MSHAALVNMAASPRIGASTQGQQLSNSTRLKQKPRYWNDDEDTLLREAIKEHGNEGYLTWKEVAKKVPNRTYRECMQRWTKVLAPGLKKGKWSSDEDQLLIKLVSEQIKIINDSSATGNSSVGTGGNKRIVWNKVSQGFKGRSCKQCRERWINHLDPSVKKSEWTQQEDLTLLQLFETMPNKWAKIARQISGRTENMVKVRWNALNRQAKKRKQTSLHYSSPRQPSDFIPNFNRAPFPGPHFNGYLPPVNVNMNGFANHNQYFINNSIINLNAQKAQGMANPPVITNQIQQSTDTKAQSQNKLIRMSSEVSEAPIDFRKNSLYMFQQCQPDFGNVNVQNLSRLQPDLALIHQREEHVRKMNLALKGLHNSGSSSSVSLLENGSGKREKQKSGKREDSLCIKEGFGDDIFKAERGLPRSGNSDQGQKLSLYNHMQPVPPTLGAVNDRRLSLTANYGFQFDEQHGHRQHPPNEAGLNLLTQAAQNRDDEQGSGGRRLSSFLYQDLVSMHPNHVDEGPVNAPTVSQQLVQSNVDKASQKVSATEN